MSIRRRPRQAEDDSTPLDEDEQLKIIEELQTQLDSQYKQIQRVFRGVCWILSIVCLFSTLFVYLRKSPQSSVFPWLHAAMSAYLQFQTPSIVVAPKTRAGSTHQVLPFRLYATVFVVSVVLAAICIGRLRMQAGTSSDTAAMYPLHQGFVLGNVLSLLVAWYLKYDMKQASKELQELNAAKYRFKTL